MPVNDVPDIDRRALADSGGTQVGQPGASDPVRRPAPKNAIVSAEMQRMPRSASGPETRLRRKLHAAGLRFTVNRRDLPGSPDLVFSRARIAVFVDGCFWHGCPIHCVTPVNNREWWIRKLDGNRERDQRKDAELLALGWMSLHIWEHEPTAEAAQMVAQLWRQRTGREC